jgi:hypothetical protein
VSMLNAMFSTKSLECLIDILPPIIYVWFLDRKRGLLLNKILEGLKISKDLTLVLKKVHPRVT